MENMGIVNSNFWNGKKVFISGNTGFKGSWLTLWLKSMGAEITGFALKPEDELNMFNILKLENHTNCIFGNITNKNLFIKSIINSNCDIAFHLAAQPLVRKSYENPYETFSTNILGTVNFFEGLRLSSTFKVGINITSDKCYENNDEIQSFDENAQMGGKDPYSCSKGCSELITSSYRESFFNPNQNNTKIASVRAGNVIGGGDFSRDRLVPDIISNFIKKKKVFIRNPLAVRPWQHVLDPLRGYLLLAEKLYDSNDRTLCNGWNFGAEMKNSKNVKWITNYLDSILPNSAGWESDKNDNPYESQYLSLDCSKAEKILGWKTKLGIEETLEGIKDWHLALLEGQNMYNLSLEQINNYLNK